MLFVLNFHNVETFICLKQEAETASIITSICRCNDHIGKSTTLHRELFMSASVESRPAS